MDGCFIGVHVFVEHAVAAHVHGVVVASGFSGTVQCEVLDACHDFVVPCQLVVQVFSLIPQHHGAGDGTSEERVFARTLGYTSPAWVTADVYHWTECP